jgi:2-oxoglutarate/2-oxoacid ferredoxin oxidoreductase subunit beta
MAEENIPVKLTENDYLSPVEIAWCPGCGNFGILKAVKKALADMQIQPQKVLFVSGIGQAGKFPHYIKCNMLNELHGRSLPAAAAAKIVNPELTVIAEGGDGDAYGEGGNHFMHAMVRNIDFTYLVHDNQIYGLTKGQASPTSEPGFVTKTTPGGAHEPLNPLALAIAANASFAARGYAGDVPHLSRIIAAAIQHKGFALVDILQPCVTFNHVNTYQYFQQRVYKLEEEADYDPGDRLKAFVKALEWGDRIPTGILYKVERPVFEDSLWQADRVSLLKRKLDPQIVAHLMEEFI